MRNRFRAGIGTLTANLASAFAWMGGKAPYGTLSIVPTYLSHLLWLISQAFRDLAKEAYGGNAAVYATVRLLTASVPEPPLIAYARRPEDGDPGDPLAWDHPLRQLIRRPNIYMTEFEFWEMVTLHTSIVGRSNWWLERNNLGQIMNLWPLRPDRVGPVYANEDDYASGERVLIGWSYLVPGTTRYLGLARRDVLTFNFPDPMGESGGIVEGLGPLQVLASEVGADNEATKYVGNLLANDARPGVVLKIKGSLKGPDALNDARIIKAAFVEDYGGTRRGEPGVVDSDTDVVQIGFNLKDLEFPNLRRIAESRIAAAFGVPAMLIGLLVGLERSTFSNYEQARAFFAESTLATYWRRFADQYTNDIASEFGAEIVCAFDLTKVRAMAIQAATQIAQIRDAADRGCVTANEYRAALQLPPIEGGDVLLMGIAPGRGMEQWSRVGQEYGVDQPGTQLPHDAAGTSVIPNGQGKATDASNTALVAAS